MKDKATTPLFDCRMNQIRITFTDLCNRRFAYFGLITSAILLFIYSNTGKLVPMCPLTFPSYSQSTELLESGTPLEISRNIFIREKFQIIQLIASTDTDIDTNYDTSKINLLLNTRKLALFAVHELNRLISTDGSKSNSCGKLRICLKWWTNPLDTMALKTNSYQNYFEHRLTFVVQPGDVPFYVRVRQNHIPPTGTNWTELEIRGQFIRLDGETIMAPPVTNLTATSTSTLTLTSTASPQSLPSPIPSPDRDPELFSWSINQSFMVGDYVDFQDRTNLYKISPGGKNITKIQDIYCGEALRMLIMVSSAPKHFEHREVIRETYGSAENLEQNKVRLVFLFGKVLDAALQIKLTKEAKKYHDIIQADFLDSYHNLSLSHLSMYNWVQTTCETVELPKYVLKADDDFLLNIELALQVAYENPSFELIGTSFCHTAPIRDTAYMYKYYTPRYMHMPDRYAGYLSGVAYLVRTDIFPRMLKISLTTPMIHMDDAYITGMLARQLGIVPVGSALFTYARSDLNACSVKKMACSYVLNPDDMKKQWVEFIKPIPSNCSLTDNEAKIPIPQPDDGYKKWCDMI